MSPSARYKIPSSDEAARFRSLDLPKIEVLEIPDEFQVMDPELIEIFRSTLDPEFENRSRICQMRSVRSPSS